MLLLVICLVLILISSLWFFSDKSYSASDFKNIIMLVTLTCSIVSFLLVGLFVLANKINEPILEKEFSTTYKELSVEYERNKDKDNYYLSSLYNEIINWNIRLETERELAYRLDENIFLKGIYYSPNIFENVDFIGRND